MNNSPTARNICEGDGPHGTNDISVNGCDVTLPIQWSSVVAADEQDSIGKVIAFDSENASMPDQMINETLLQVGEHILDQLSPPDVMALARTNHEIRQILVTRLSDPSTFKTLWKKAWPSPLMVEKDALDWHRAVVAPTWMTAPLTREAVSLDMHPLRGGWSINLRWLASPSLTFSPWQRSRQPLNEAVTVHAEVDVKCGHALGVAHTPATNGRTHHQVRRGLVRRTGTWLRSLVHRGGWFGAFDAEAHPRVNVMTAPSGHVVLTVVSVNNKKLSYRTSRRAEPPSVHIVASCPKLRAALWLRGLTSDAIRS